MQYYATFCNNLHVAPRRAPTRIVSAWCVGLINWFICDGKPSGPCYSCMEVCKDLGGGQESRPANNAFSSRQIVLVVPAWQPDLVVLACSLGLLPVQKECPSSWPVWFGLRCQVLLHISLNTLQNDIQLSSLDGVVLDKLRRRTFGMWGPMDTAFFQFIWATQEQSQGPPGPAHPTREAVAIDGNWGFKAWKVVRWSPPIRPSVFWLQQLV